MGYVILVAVEGYRIIFYMFTQLSIPYPGKAVVLH